MQINHEEVRMKRLTLIPLIIIGLILSKNSIAANYFENIVKTIVKIDKAQKDKNLNNNPAQPTKSDEKELNQPYWNLDYNKPYWYLGHIKSNNPMELKTKIEEVEAHIESISTANPFRKEELAKIKDVFVGDQFTLQAAPRNAILGKISYNNEPSGCWAYYNKLSIDSLYSTTIGCSTNVFGKQRGVEIRGVRTPPFDGLSYTVFSAKVGGVAFADANIEAALIERMGPPEIINFFDYRKPIDVCKASIYGKYYDFMKSQINDEKINGCLIKLKSIRNAGGFFSGISMIIENGLEKTMKFKKDGTIFELSIYGKTHKEVSNFLEQLMAENPTQSLTVYTEQSLSTHTKISESVINFVTTQEDEKKEQNKNDF